MNGFLRLLMKLTMISLLSFSVVRCSTQQASSDEGNTAAEESLDSDSTLSSSSDDFNSADPLEEPAKATATDVAEDSLEKEFNDVEGAPPATVAEAPQPPAPEIAPDPVVEAPVETPPAPVVVEEPPASAPAEEKAQIAQIKNIKYRANDNGGTVVVEADAPLTFETRMNASNNQFVIEIPNSKLPAKLKRPFNTKDMKGGIGAIDTYQNRGSTTTRVVVQLRDGAAEPVVQSEGNSLLIVGSGATQSVAQKSEATASGPADDNDEAKILSSATLEEFLAGNIQFYGKKISLETSDMDIRDAIKFISEESGVNLVLSEEVKGTVSVKLRQVPWDQALVVIMRSKKLGYTRSGNVLRIASLTDIKAEEDETVKMATAKKALVPLKVRIVPVSYAKIDDLVTQVKVFLSDRGKVMGDNRTSSLVISDVEENLDRAIKLVNSIDIPPHQVLIEGKVVEATDQFQRDVGIKWGGDGTQFDTGISGYKGRQVVGRASTDISPGLPSSKSFGLNFQLGTLDILGDLTASLQLYEQKNMAKVLSSPRIVTLHNEPAEINQTTEVPLIQSTVSNGVETKTASFKPVKLKLSVTPQITNDGSVIMTVDVNRDFLSGVADATTGARPVNSRAAKTKVLVKNGQTAVIGGIYQSDQGVGETKVPWIGDIPIIGWLFKNQSRSEQRNELLIFITPRILGQTDSQGIPSEMTNKEF
jgi:type IV pilus assembly protein PilQ